MGRAKQPQRKKKIRLEKDTRINLLMDIQARLQGRGPGLERWMKIHNLKEAAKTLGISIATLDTARNNGLIAYVQYVQNGCVYFTDASLQEYIAKFTHRAKPVEKCATYRKVRSAEA